MVGGGTRTFLSTHGGSGLTCRQPETTPGLSWTAMGELGALTCVAHLLCSGEGTNARPEAIPSALPSPAQGPSPHGSPELREPRLQFRNWEQRKSDSTCKTDHCIDKTGAPHYWRQLHFSGPDYGGSLLLPRIRQHNICFVHLW